MQLPLRVHTCDPRRDAPPRLPFVDQALDGVPLLVELGVVVDGPSPLRPFLFRLTAWSRFSGMTALMPRLVRDGDQALQQGLEDTGVAPLPETVVDGRPGTELGGHFPPLTARPKSPQHPSNCCRSRTGYGPYSPIRQVRLDELPFHVGQLRTCHARRSTGSKISARGNSLIDHDPTRALVEYVVQRVADAGQR